MHARPVAFAVTLNYDGQRRLTSVTDAVGRQTTLTYGVAGQPFLVGQVTDPFGRSATLTYNGHGNLASITDIIGITSSFGYDANLLVNSMTTPYGTTTFAYTAPGASGPPRFAEITDPMGFKEREEWLEPSSAIPGSDPVATVPTGMPLALTNNYLQFRNSFHWDKEAYVSAGCTPSGGCDYTKARLRHFTHVIGMNIKNTSLESEKQPLENRVWYAMPGQTHSAMAALSPSRRRSDACSTTAPQAPPVQLRRCGLFQPDEDDPSAGAHDHLHLCQPGRSRRRHAGHRERQPDQSGAIHLHLSAPAGVLHRRIRADDQLHPQCGGPAHFRHQSAERDGEFQYDPAGNLSTAINANNATGATYTYDSFARVRTYTDSEGWTATYDYDAADRVTKVTYPDGTTDTYTYDRLDLVSYTDRQYRTWTYVHDANRRLTSVTDPQGQQTQYGYNKRGQVTTLTDPKTNVTSWTDDVQGRLVGKQYPDTSTVTYAYETTTSRLKSVTDTASQVKTYSYAKDDRLTAIAYTGAVNPTPNVGFTWDPYFPRLASRTDGVGTTQFTYVPVGSLGALQVQQEAGPFTNSAIASAYDELGRLASRTVQGAGAEIFQYDAIGRLAGHTSDLGAFTLSYLGQTGQITSRQLASSTLATT